MNCIQDCAHYIWGGKGSCEGTEEEYYCVCDDIYLSTDDFGRPSCVSYQAHIAVQTITLLMGLVLAIHGGYWLTMWCRQQASKEAQSRAAEKLQTQQTSVLGHCKVGFLSKGREQGRKLFSSLASQRNLYFYGMVYGFLSGLVGFLFLVAPSYNYTHVAAFFFISNIFAQLEATCGLALMCKSVPVSQKTTVVGTIQRYMKNSRSFKTIQVASVMVAVFPSLLLLFWDTLLAIKYYIWHLVWMILYSGIFALLMLRRLIAIMQDAENRTAHSSQSYSKYIIKARAFKGLIATMISTSIPYFVLLCTAWKPLWESPLLSFSLANSIFMLFWPHCLFLMFPVSYKARSKKIHVQLQTS